MARYCTYLKCQKLVPLPKLSQTPAQKRMTMQNSHPDLTGSGPVRSLKAFPNRFSQVLCLLVVDCIANHIQVHTKRIHRTTRATAKSHSPLGPEIVFDRRTNGTQPGKYLQNSDRAHWGTQTYCFLLVNSRPVSPHVASLAVPSQMMNRTQLIIFSGDDDDDGAHALFQSG